MHDHLGLFGDLIIVASIMNACNYVVDSYFMECTPPSSWECTVANATAATCLEKHHEVECDNSVLPVHLYLLVMWSITRNWSTEVELKARFRSDDRVHPCLDFLGYATLLCTTSYIPHRVQDPNHQERNMLYIFLLVHQIIWWLRWLEIAVLSRSEAARRFAGGQVVDGLPPLVLMMACIVADSETRHVTMVSLLWYPAQFWVYLREGWRQKRKEWLVGPHWAAERTSVPAAVSFMIDRHHELLMIMLGEQVIQLGISATHEHEHATERRTVRIVGFLLVIGLLYTVGLSVPHAADDHPFARGGFVKVAFQFSFLCMAVFMPVFGFCLELALHHPLGFACPHQTRAFVSIFCGVLIAALLQQMAALQWAGVSMSICQTPWRTRRVFLLACRYASIGLIVPLWVAATNGADATDGMLSEDLPTYALVICLALAV